MENEGQLKDTVAHSALFAQCCLLTGGCWEPLFERSETWKKRFLKETMYEREGRVKNDQSAGMLTLK